MQTYDLLMLIVLGGLGLYGYFKGMAWQIAYLASFVASYFVATRFDDQFAPLFGDAAPWNKLIAMAVIYAATSFAIWMLFRVVRGGIDSAKLNSFDRQMGAAVGLLRGAVWCLGITFVALTFVSQFMPGVRGHIIQSRSGHYIAKFIDESQSLFPPEVHQVIGPYLDQIDRGLDPNQPQPQGLPNFGGQQVFGGQPAGGGQQVFGGQPTSNPVGGAVQQASEFLNNLPGQISGLRQQLQDAGVSVGSPASQPAPRSTGQTGLPAWPQQPGLQPARPAGRPITPATPAGWPAPPAGAGWPSR